MLAGLLRGGNVGRGEVSWFVAHWLQLMWRGLAVAATLAGLRENFKTLISKNLDITNEERCAASPRSYPPGNVCPTGKVC